MAEARQIIARGSRAACEAASAALEAALEDVAFAYVEIDEARWRLDAYPADDEEAAAVAALLTARADLQVKSVILADADWIALSLSGLPPVRAGRFFVYGAHDRGRVPVNAIALRIEAGAAFGTGHHGTTTGCLLALDRLLKARRFERVLDLGTGTGLLAIAAALAGSRIVVGTDIDPPSVAIAAANAALNQARARFVVAEGLNHPLPRAGAPYDLVFANILATPLIGLAQDVRCALRPGGVAILSGLLRSQARAVRAAYVDRGFRLLFRLDLDAWTTLALARRG